MIPISAEKILFYNDDKEWKYNSELQQLVTNVSVAMEKAQYLPFNVDISNDYVGAFTLKDSNEFKEEVETIYPNSKVTVDNHSITLTHKDATTIGSVMRTKFYNK
jgi:hypothetical protein